jgi:hypothetical protein
MQRIAFAVGRQSMSRFIRPVVAAAFIVLAATITFDAPRVHAQSGPVVSVRWSCWAGPTPGVSILNEIIDPGCGAYSRTNPSIHLTPRGGAMVSTPIVVPDAPTSLRSEQFGDSVTFTWNAPLSQDPSTTYVLEAGSAPGRSDVGTLNTKSAAGSATTTNVPPGTYFVRVRTRTAHGTSAASNEIAVTVGTRDCGSIPLAPSGLTTSVTGTTIFLSWQPAIGGCPATSYLIEAGSQFGLADLAAISTGDAATSFAWTNAPNGSYVVRVRGVNATGVGPNADGVRVTVPGGPAAPACSALPSPPTQLAANITGSTVVLTWNPSASAPATYVLEAGSASGLSDLFVTVTSSAAAIAVTASPGTYYMRLRARTNCGTSVPGNEIVVAVGNNTATPVSPSMPLVRASDLVYQGSFRLPLDDFGIATFAYAGSALAFNPARGSLFLTGHDWYQQVAEISAPPADAANFPTATLLQPLSDATEGRLSAVNPGDQNAKKIGGLLPYAGNLYITGYSYYDGAATQVLSHFVSGLDLSISGDLRGPFQVGSLKAGYVSGYMGLVPSAWQAALGGPVLTGQCCIAIVSRTSFGPALFSMDPRDIGSKNPVPVTPLVYYPANHPLGLWDGTNAYFNGSTEVRGVVFPEGTGSVLFFGRHGMGRFCYGAGTAMQSLAGQQVPNEPGVIYCYDPEDGSKGTHGYPYADYIWAFNATDLAAVRNGQVQPWDVRPYATWTLDLPTSAWSTHINGAAYDPQTGRIFVSQAFGDGAKPLIHVFTVRIP